MEKLTVALDLMGGDAAPEVNVEAAAAALKEGIGILAFGDEAAVSLMKKVSGADNLETCICSEVIGYDESAVRAIRSKKNSSIYKAFIAVKEKRSVAVVSAGSTGALVAGGVLLLGRDKHVDKPCLGAVFPSENKRGVLFLDLGASADVRPANLLQFAVMGSIYASEVLGWSQPKVSLLNIGAEPDKGNMVTRQAYRLLKRSPINFAGNIEARDVFTGNTDVVVTDGFTGNIFLKACEGTSTFLLSTLKQEISASIFSKIPASFLKQAFSRTKALLDYSAYGGAPLLGLTGCVVKCHGSSDARAIYNGIKSAIRFVERDVSSVVSTALAGIMPEGE